MPHINEGVQEVPEFVTKEEMLRRYKEKKEQEIKEEE